MNLTDLILNEGKSVTASEELTCGAFEMPFGTFIVKYESKSCCSTAVLLMANPALITNSATNAKSIIKSNLLVNLIFRFLFKIL